MRKKEILLIFLIMCSMSVMGQLESAVGRPYYQNDTTSIYSGKYGWNLYRIVNLMKWIEADRRSCTDSVYISELDTMYHELKAYHESRVNYALMDRQINLINSTHEKDRNDYYQRSSPWGTIRKEILSKKPDDTDQLVLDGLKLSDENKPDKAHEYFKKAVEKDPTRLNNYFFVIMDEMELTRDTSKALEYLDKVISLSHGTDISSFHPYTIRAWINTSRKQYILSIDDLNYTLEKGTYNEAESSMILNSIGWNYYLLKEYNLCLEYAGKSLLLNPDNPLTLDTRGSGYFGLGEYEKCIDDMTRATLLNPEQANSWYLRGLSNLKLKRQDQAVSDLSKASDFGIVEAAVALKGLGLSAENKDVENQRQFPNKKIPNSKNHLRIDRYGIYYRF